MSSGTYTEPLNYATNFYVPLLIHIVVCSTGKLAQKKMKNRNIPHKDDWATPPYFYDELNKEFDFNFDPCPYQHDIETWNGLEIDWKERNFINPPYSRKLKDAFVIKAINESKKGKLCVMLLPVSTSTQLFHKHILPNQKEIRFIEKIIKFCGVNTKGEYVTGKAGMHDSMVVVFDGRTRLISTNLNRNTYEHRKN